MTGFNAAKIERDERGCWNWTGARSAAGYGVTRAGYVHRLSYELHVGPIPSGLELDHLCRNRACCNPAHLEAVTHAENMRRGYFGTKTHCPAGHAYDETRTCRVCKNARRRKSPEPRSTTHCPHGHVKSPENRTTSGHCRECHRERNRALKARKRGAAA